jgi:hypothetical protein
MPKPVAITADDLKSPSSKPKKVSSQRSGIRSADLVPLQFRMSPDFVREFKQAALDANMKLNELLKICFAEYQQKHR